MPVCMFSSQGNQLDDYVVIWLQKAEFKFSSIWITMRKRKVTRARFTNNLLLEFQIESTLNLL